MKSHKTKMQEKHNCPTLKHSMVGVTYTDSHSEKDAVTPTIQQLLKAALFSPEEEV